MIFKCSLVKEHLESFNEPLGKDNVKKLPSNSMTRQSFVRIPFVWRLSEQKFKRYPNWIMKEL